MEVLVRYVESDFLDMMLARYRLTPVGKAMVRRIKVKVALLVCMLVVVISIITARALPHIWYLLAIGLGSVVYFVSMRHFWNSISRNSGSIFRSGKNLDYCAPTTLCLSVFGVERKNEYVEARYSWKVVEGIDETETAIFFWVGSVAAFNIPKRCFKTAEDAAAFLDFARREWSAATGTV